MASVGDVQIHLHHLSVEELGKPFDFVVDGRRHGRCYLNLFGLLRFV